MHKRRNDLRAVAPPGDDPSDPRQRSVLDGASPTCSCSAMKTCSRIRSRGVIELARHLGIRLEQSEAARIAAEYSHESNKARTEALRRRLQEAGVDLDSAANAQICDPNDPFALEPHPSGRFEVVAHARQRAATANARAPLRPVAQVARLYFRIRRAGESQRCPSANWFAPRSTSWSDVRTFLVRATSLRYPRTVRTIKRILGFPPTAPAGATAWADAASASFQDQARSGEPHISFTEKSDRDERSSRRERLKHHSDHSERRFYRDVDLADAQGLRGYSCFKRWANSSARPSCLSWR